MCCGEEGSEGTPPSCLTTLHVQSGQLRVCGGRQVAVHVMANRRLHSKRKKRKALATHHLFFYQSNNLQKEGSPHFWQVTAGLVKKKISYSQVQKKRSCFAIAKTTVVESSAKKNRAFRPIRSVAFFASSCCCCLIGQVQKKQRQVQKKHRHIQSITPQFNFQHPKNCSKNVRKQFDRRIFRTASSEAERRQPKRATQQRHHRRNHRSFENRSERR